MRHFLTALLSLVVLMPLAAQEDAFEKFRQQQNAKFNQFKQDKQAEYDAFRRAQNEKYAEFMRQHWDTVPVQPAVEPVKEEEVPPVVFEDQEEDNQNQQQEQQEREQNQEQEEDNQENDSLDNGQDEQQKNEPEPEPEPIPVQPDVVEIPKPEPAPEPIAPVVPKEDLSYKKVSIGFYGTIVTIGFPKDDNLRINGKDEGAMADAWQALAGENYDITVKTALDARKNLALCDWAYMNMLRSITEKQYGDTNEAVLMQAYLMTQSGYRIRLGLAGGRLYMLVATLYEIYGMSYITLDNTAYYIIGKKTNQPMQLCRGKFDKEKSLSLQIERLPALNEELTPKRTLTSRKGVTASVSVNKNLIDFFGMMPQACVAGDFTTRWAAYANTPLDKNVRETLYPALQRTIKGMNERDAVGILLNWVQTAFTYGYDNEVWGDDRAFFAQETLYYPYSDCEDRAILFSRLVRDLVGLDVVLLYYPGHLATAVAFKEQTKGDWLTYRNRKYIVCDPTYENASIGMTMPGMNNQQAKIIALQ